MASKTEYTYCRALHEIIVLLEYNWDPCTITINFDAALIQSVKYEFPNSRMVGCFFHFKQAIIKHIKKLHIPKKEPKASSQLIDNLTLIKSKHIKSAIKRIEQNKKTSSSYVG
jgi:hypothetical protein